MTTETTERALNWDDPIEHDGTEFILLPAGTYSFTVTKFERARFEGSDKMPACNQANVSLEIDGGELGKTTIVDKLKLHTKTEWLLCAFFKAIGHRKHGEPLRMDWGKVVGARGHCKVGVRKGTGQYADKEYNEVKGYIESVETFVAGAPQQEEWAGQF